MRMLQFSRREELLLCAALNPDAAAAATSWKEWAAEIRLEDAPYPELRLLPAVYAHLSHIAPSFKLPNKLRGKAKATFTKNSLMAHGCLPNIEELSQHSPVLLTKGLAICIRFNAWASRVMGDVDIHIELRSLEKVCEVLARSGWTPKYGLTWASLVQRIPIRRNSWNLTKAGIELDLHWRVQQGPAENWLAATMWGSAEQAEFLDRRLLLQSPELAFITALEHGFIIGTHADALQTIVDAALLLPVCKMDRLLPLLHKSDLFVQFTELIMILQKAGLSEVVSNHHRSLPGYACDKAGEVVPAKGRVSVLRPQIERAVLRRPIRYQLWQALGRKSRIERLIVRWSGPFSRPLAWSQTFNQDYDLRDCEVIDQIAGPGWGWPEPDHSCFWSDRADARLLIPLKHVSDHLIVLGLADSRVASPNACINVFANGAYLSTLNCSKRLSTSEYCLIVPRRVLFGPWVELSFRPQPYLGEGINFPGDYPLRRSVPVRRLRIFDLQKMGEIFSGYYVPRLYFTILEAGEPQASKFGRIKSRMENSPYRNSSELPTDFNPVWYVLSYPDLFEHEVDPYEHFVRYGRHEGRLWR